MADEEHKGLPVSGYVPQSAMAVELVNSFKEDEERLLRRLDGLFLANVNAPRTERPPYDGRMVALARTAFQEGFMWLNRSVFQPTRISLPEDEAAAG